ncbi:hypothetical protein R1sor_014579 [Riccia sorocarpa]|uniref:Uncharacterized protein n=1 Tax=Riccia sorocarpa TaxID=122646 RepID=A0ABD3HCY8_9MARC
MESLDIPGRNNGGRNRAAGKVDNRAGGGGNYTDGFTGLGMDGRRWRLLMDVRVAKEKGVVLSEGTNRPEEESMEEDSMAVSANSISENSTRNSSSNSFWSEGVRSASRQSNHSSLGSSAADSEEIT